MFQLKRPLLPTVLLGSLVNSDYRLALCRQATDIDSSLKNASHKYAYIDDFIDVMKSVPI